jgi:hypothetical protein
MLSEHRVIAARANIDFGVLSAMKNREKARGYFKSARRRRQTTAPA